MKRKVLIFVDWFKPAFKAGGPIQSMANLIEHLSEELDLYLICSDHDYNETKSLSGINTGKWSEVDGAHVMYLDSFSETMSYLKPIVFYLEPDVIYVNGMFSKTYSRLPIKIAKSLGWKDRLIISPRGMLAQGAMSVKPLKKNMFFSMHSIIGTYSGIKFHASSIQEQEDIKSIISSGAQVECLSNLPRQIKIQDRKRPKEEGVLNVLCLSRVSPEKNIHFAIERLIELAEEIDWTLNIYGSVNDISYLRRCEGLLDEVSSNGSITFHQAIDEDQISEVFAQSDLMFLPTLGENYGHAIVESLGSSCPVLISDQTQWVKLKETSAGIDIPLDDKSSFVDSLSVFAKMGEEEHKKWREGARVYYDENVNLHSLKTAYLKMFGAE